MRKAAGIITAISKILRGTNNESAGDASLERAQEIGDLPVQNKELGI